MTQSLHIAATELDIGETELLSLVPRQRKQPVREIDAEDMAIPPDCLRRRDRRGAATAAHVEHSPSRPWSQPLHRASAIAAPEPKWAGVEVVGGSVVRGGYRPLRVIHGSSSRRLSRDVWSETCQEHCVLALIRVP